MAHEVGGVPVTAFEEPIYTALRRYSIESGERVHFDVLSSGITLEPAPDKPYAARSTGTVYYEYEPIGDLTIIAFEPNDATGNDETYRTGDFVNGSFRDDPRYYPRSKASVHAEVHLALVSQNIDSMDDPVLFAGHLGMLSLVGGTHLSEIGYVGQPSHSFMTSMQHGRLAQPRVTLTTGYRGELTPGQKTGERFGDPHALLNRSLYAVQIAGFMAISPEAAPKHLDALRALGASEPHIGGF